MGAITIAAMKTWDPKAKGPMAGLAAELYPKYAKRIAPRTPRSAITGIPPNRAPAEDSNILFRLKGRMIALTAVRNHTTANRKIEFTSAVMNEVKNSRYIGITASAEASKMAT